MDENGIEDGGRAAPNRREFIRRGVIALGLGAWGVPLVQVVRSRHGGSPKVDGGPEEIGVQVVTEACTTCVVVCEEPIICGSDFFFDCICAPSADPYPLADCVCATAIFCDDAIPCSEGCPEGWACAQGCCDEPVCLPPCPVGEPDPIAPFSAENRAATPSGGGRLTVSGKRL